MRDLLPTFPKPKSTLQNRILWELSWGLGRPTGREEGALPDGSDGGLQGGDHVFDEEVIPVAPVLRYGVGRPGIWEGRRHISMAGHSTWKGSGTWFGQSYPNSTS